LIFLPNHGWLIYTPPHVSSKALGRACAQHGAIIYAEPCPDGSNGFDHHGVSVPNGLEHCRRAIVVRNPYDRAVGLWHHLVWWNSLGGFGCSDYQEFCRWLRAGRHPAVDLSWLYLWPISRWLRELTYHVALRYEFLEDDVRHWMGLDLRLPRESIVQRKPWPDYYTPQETVDCVTEWGARDFPLGGYEPGVLVSTAPRDALSPYAQSR